MKKETIKGEIFIVPNTPYTSEELGWFDIRHWEDWAKKIQVLLNNFEGDITVEEPMIQVWATNEICDNFADHLRDYARMIGIPENRENRFPSHLPYSLLKGLKEGDRHRLQTKNGVMFELKVSQMTYRYPFGNFEEVLEGLL